MKSEVTLLSPPANFAVVQLPGRNYPGVVVQGDTLHSLVEELREMQHSLQAREYEDLKVALDSLRDRLEGALQGYEAVCEERRIDLPYSKR
jgi:signal transduction histidine kinase